MDPWVTSQFRFLHFAAVHNVYLHPHRLSALSKMSPRCPMILYIAATAAWTLFVLPIGVVESAKLPRYWSRNGNYPNNHNQNNNNNNNDAATAMPQPRNNNASNLPCIEERGGAFIGNNNNAGNDCSSSSTTTTLEGGEKETEHHCDCDYLVVGAGTAGMSFVDTLLTEHPSATVVLVDRNERPGGHWVHAYPFCRLHQPSCFYGVNSLPLGKNRNPNGVERYDVDDRATRDEILAYYQTVRERFEATGRVRCFFGVEYRGRCDEDDDNEVQQQGESVHKIVRTTDDSSDDSSFFFVKCRKKLVKVANPITVPSMRKRPTNFDVDPSVPFVPVNDVPACVESGKHQHYVVLGSGKTGADAVVYLLEHGNVPPPNITWVVPRDAWYMLRDCLRDYFETFAVFDRGLCRTDSVRDCFLSFEKDGFVGRLDPNRTPPPGVFKAPVVSHEELECMRSIPNTVRLGRVASIEPRRVVLEKGSLAVPSPENTLFVDCTADRDNVFFDLDEDFEIFRPGTITLGPLTSFYNPSGSAARIAFLECALDDDEKKNECCFFVRGSRYTTPTPDYFVGMTYMEAKSIDALMKVPGGMKFYLSSRTFSESPQHHNLSGWLGTLRFLWLLYGPKKLAGFSKHLFQKVESKGYSDIDHCWGIETM